MSNTLEDITERIDRLEKQIEFILNEKRISEKIFEDNEIIVFVQDNLFDPWKNTPFKDYVYIDPKQKGDFGELFVTKFMKANDYIVDKTKKNNGPYDRYISSSKIKSDQSTSNYMIPTEIKFSLAQKDKKTKGIIANKFIINHIGRDKSWERLIFVCINGEKEKDWVIKWFKKTDFKQYLENNNKLFNRQQGGKKGINDDWMCSSPQSFELSSEPWVHDIADW